MNASTTYLQTHVGQKRIGEILTDAHLVTQGQLQVALYDQQAFSSHRLGEIFVMRGWLKQQTVDFFADQWRILCNCPTRQSLGTYLIEAGLLTEDAVNQIIADQRHNGYRFGANAVLRGFIHQETLDYFLKELFPEKSHDAPIVFNEKLNQQLKAKRTIPPTPRSPQTNTSPKTNQFILRETVEHRKSKETTPPVTPQNDDVEWVG